MDTQGASGATNAILLFYIFCFPNSTVFLHFFIPVPAALVVSNPLPTIRNSANPSLDLSLFLYISGCASDRN